MDLEIGHLFVVAVTQGVVVVEAKTIVIQMQDGAEETAGSKK